MNYCLTCKSCAEKVEVSTHGAIKYIDENKKMLSFDCPICGEEIIVEYKEQ